MRKAPVALTVSSSSLVLLLALAGDVTSRSRFRSRPDEIGATLSAGDAGAVPRHRRNILGAADPPVPLFERRDPTAAVDISCNTTHNQDWNPDNGR
jgi:hypothetical protein